MHDVICPEVEMWISGLSDAMFNLSQSQSFTIKTNIYNYGCSRKKSKSLSEIRAASIFSLFRFYDIGFFSLVVIVICECDYFAKKLFCITLMYGQVVRAEEMSQLTTFVLQINFQAT